MRIAAFLNLEIEHGRGILRGIARKLRQQPGLTILKFSQSGGYQLDKLRKLKLDGIICRVGTGRDERVLLQSRIPVVNVAGQIPTPKIPLVSSDDRLVGRLAVRHLAGRGYRNLAYCGTNQHEGSELRFEGMKAEAAALDPRCEVARHALPQGDQTAPYPEAIRRKLEPWLAGLPKPVAILGFTDRVALELDEACSKLGLKVPEQVAILGVGNDLTRIEFAATELSSIQLNTQRIGEIAAETLLQMLAGEKSAPMEMLVSPLKIVTRRSTDRFAVEDETVMLALDHMREHIGNPIYVSEVAQSAGVSRRVLEMKFQQVLGATVNQTIQRLHLERSIELMADPGLTLSEIAYTCGFGSAAAFSTLFRSRYNEPPGKYREKLLGRGSGRGVSD